MSAFVRSFVCWFVSLDQQSSSREARNYTAPLLYLCTDPRANDSKTYRNSFPFFAYHYRFSPHVEHRARVQNWIATASTNTNTPIGNADSFALFYYGPNPATRNDPTFLKPYLQDL